MKLNNTMIVLMWLAKYLLENKPEEFGKLKKKDSWWNTLDSFTCIRNWVILHVNTKSIATQQSEKILRQLGLISHKECSGSTNLRKAALREIAGLMKIKECNYKISRKDLEEEITKFARTSV